MTKNHQHIEKMTENRTIRIARDRSQKGRKEICRTENGGQTISIEVNNRS